MTEPATGGDAAADALAPASVLALDLGGTQLRAAVVTADGGVHGRSVARTPRGGNSRLIVDECLAVLARARRVADDAGAHAALGRPVPAPLALGISAPGPLDPRTGRFRDPPNLDRSLWSFPLAEVLAKAVGLPAVMDKDTNVAALAEGRYGAARGLADYVYMTVSTGVGGAVVSGGRLVVGADGAAGELGHLMVDPVGPRCGCGVHGHLEAYSSGTGIAAQLRRSIAEGEVGDGTPLARLATERGGDALEARDVALAEAAGDPLAAAIMERARGAFASAMVTVANVFNPSRIVVGGGIALGQGERLLEPARQQVREQAFRVQATRVEIVAAELGDDVGLVGALPLVAERLRRPPTGGETERKPGATAPAGFGLTPDATADEQSGRTKDGPTTSNARPVEEVRS